jgi:hypothetical protein
VVQVVVMVVAVVVFDVHVWLEVRVRHHANTISSSSSEDVIVRSVVNERLRLGVMHYDDSSLSSFSSSFTTFNSSPTSSYLLLLLRTVKPQVEVFDGPGVSYHLGHPVPKHLSVVQHDSLEMRQVEAGVGEGEGVESGLSQVRGGDADGRLEVGGGPVLTQVRQEEIAACDRRR